MKESEWIGILASDSTGVDRYDYEVRFVKSKRKFEKILVKQAYYSYTRPSYNTLTSKKTHDSP
ncbi:MAG TPA: hypothetical protein VEH06_09225, partial [Candidatus Bathyarchaeia archaeon]|nr:hypothetical protein [Candidatus Bathyarchaeia archaeon]